MNVDCENIHKYLNEGISPAVEKGKFKKHFAATMMLKCEKFLFYEKREKKKAGKKNFQLWCLICMGMIRNTEKSWKAHKIVNNKKDPCVMWKLIVAHAFVNFELKALDDAYKIPPQAMFARINDLDMRKWTKTVCKSLSQ